MQGASISMVQVLLLSLVSCSIHMAWAVIDGEDNYRCHASGLQQKSSSPEAHVDEKSLPTVSVVMPTNEGRHRFHELVDHMFNWQSYPASKISMLINDASYTDSPLADKWRQDLRITYHRDVPSKDRPLGQRRNWLVDHASGDVIVHFDDDDFYNKNYVRYMVGYLLRHKIQMVKIVGWHDLIPLRPSSHKVSDGAMLRGSESSSFAAVCTSNPYSGWAFSWTYRKGAFSQCRFKAVPTLSDEGVAECISRHWGQKAVHQIGDATSQLLKVDTCDGITGAHMLYSSSAEHNGKSLESLKETYGEDAIQMLATKGLPYVDVHRCYGDSASSFLQLER